MDELDSIKVTFFQECDELMGDLEGGLLAMQSGQGDADTVNAVFRAVHSVKGGAGAFGFDALVRFAHAFETLLDDVRASRVELGEDGVALLLRAADVLADQVSAARQGVVADEAAAQALMAELLAAGTAGGETADDADDDGMGDIAFPAPIDLGFGAPAPLPVTLDLEPAPVETALRITFRPHRSLYAKANEPGLLLRELERQGKIEVELDAAALPPLDQLDPEESYLIWTITAAAERAAVAEVFEFVDGDCELGIEDSNGATEDVVAALMASVAAPLPAEEPEIDIAALIARVTEPHPAEPDPAPLAVAPEPAPAPAAAAPPAPAPDSAPARVETPPAATIRVEPGRVDRLIDLVGELVINQAMLAERAFESGIALPPAFQTGLDELEQLTREIQDSVMAIRAQPVKSVFQRMPRLVREVAAQTGKRARLVTEGETTEVDKTVIERISDPITHMLRNAIDHGLESPEARLAAGKPAEGTVRLAALHRGGRIVIEVSDDGGGIDRDRVRAIAVNKGLIAADADLSHDEVDNLIFLPGFSTAATVTDVSGRGVGMDVVRRSVQALGGRISISSRPGEGSTFTLSLPLTLAVLDGMVIDVAGQALVIPLGSIVESLRPREADVRRQGPQDVLLAVRDSFIPVIDIGAILGFRAEPVDPAEAVAILIETEDGAPFALTADAIQGQRQVVIKSLETNYRQVEGIAAATILGDGRVALILDVDAFAGMRRRDRRPAPETALFAAE